MEYFTRHQQFKDIFNIVVFIIAVIIGAWLINLLLFRSFDVSGPSMEPTLFTSDRLIVSRLPITFSAILHKNYLPNRGHVIVFKNPFFSTGGKDEYIVKRVIGLPGERVVVSDGKVSVYNNEHPEGFNPYDTVNIIKTSVSGNVDRTVPEGEIFVIGDNRSANYSLDSRNGLSTIPLNDVIGPVVARIFPFTKITTDF